MLTTLVNGIIRCLTERDNYIFKINHTLKGSSNRASYRVKMQYSLIKKVTSSEEKFLTPNLMGKPSKKGMDIYCMMDNGRMIYHMDMASSQMKMEATTKGNLLTE